MSTIRALRGNFPDCRQYGHFEPVPRNFRIAGDSSATDRSDTLTAMRFMCLLAIAASISVYCTGCDENDLRGSWSPSKDGKTYLAVADDNGGHCGPIKVDRKIWPHRVGEAAQIKPGNHTIECGGEIGFDIRPGVVYRFSYWGP